MGLCLVGSSTNRATSARGEDAAKHNAHAAFYHLCNRRFQAGVIVPACVPASPR